MNLMEIEDAARCAWPAFEEKEMSFGVLRYSRGTDRRSNSLSLYPYADFEAEELITAVEKFYSERDAAPIVKIVRPKGIAIEALKGIDSALQLKGYEKQAPTFSMLLDLSSMSAMRVSVKAAPIETVDAGSWLQSWYALTARPLEKMQSHKALLEKSALSHRYLLGYESGGAVVSSGMAVCANQTMGLFGISTAIEHRKRGYALATIASLLKWGREKGARFAYLQVEESNQAAVKLYQKLGFKSSYSYWYRVGKHHAGKGDRN